MRPSLVVLGITAASASISLPGCGSGGGALCGGGVACGGDIVGDWSVVGYCDTFTTAFADCPNATFDNSGVDASGIAHFGADLTYAVNVTLSGALTLTLPAACVRSGTSLSCLDLDSSFASTVLDPDSSFTTAGCQTVDGGSCRCAFAFRPTTSADSGTYISSDGSLTMFTSGGNVNAASYCATASSLEIISPNSNGGLLFTR
jgi:hypothetical protein